MRLLNFVVITVLSGCQSVPEKTLRTKMSRPDLLNEFDPGANDINNISPIAEAVFVGSVASCFFSQKSEI
ncbi:MAG: hypothetical protein HRT37_26175 [Alteromonadaceae bacterium]|nr:hypothetical protein [Alteromonadaceae bacterium]